MDWIKPDGGRKIIKTGFELTGNAQADLEIIKKILKQTLPLHKNNVLDMDRLFSIFYNNQSIVEKSKEQRSDINNKIPVANAYSIVRTINAYCFGEPFKYLANDTNNQQYVEKFNAIMNGSLNYQNTIRATLNSSICGIGYKIALPTKDDELPFEMNGNIDPRKAYCVYSDYVIPQIVMGVYIQDLLNEKGTKIGNKYTVWTKNYQYFLKDDKASNNYYSVISQYIDGKEVIAYPLTTNQVPLIEIPRNKFRLGDYELVVPLFDLKNQIMSNRIDDIQQAIDYLLVLTNCMFEDEKDKQSALTSRLLQIKSTDKNNPCSAEILKNSLDQAAIQQLADYVDILIQEITGIPNRQERGGGGGDTGQAVRFRNGFRDLENNAGLIVPEMEAAELKFAKVCLSYCNNLSKNPIGKALNSLDIKVVFKRTLTDDPLASAQAFNYFVISGMNPTDALIASKSVSDPAEVGSRCKQIAIKQVEVDSSASSTIDENNETSENEQG